MKKSKLYFKDFSLKDFLTIFSIATIIFLLRQYLYIGINKFVITPFRIDEINKNINLDLLAIFIFSGTLIWLINLLVLRKLVPSINSSIKIILITICYIIVIRSCNVYELEPIEILPSIKYLDILLFCILIIISKFKYYNRQNDSESIYGFIEDNFNPEVNRDILGRKNYAHQIGLKILGTHSLKKAFVIAINSPWGFGKSGFLQLIEQFFKDNSKQEFIRNATRSSEIIDTPKIDRLFFRSNNTIVVRYNPWKNFDDKKIVQDFFDELSVSISKYDSQLSKKIKKYGKYLSKLNDSIFSKVTEFSLDSIACDHTLTGLFEEINNSIDRIQKKIIVFVDDLDRLTGDELIDILKLIRNTANFGNTFFIVAYDHNYVLNTIEKKNLISSKEEYLHKIVQLEITLPTFQKNILIQFLEEQIEDYQNLSFGFGKIKLAINEILAINVLTEPKPGTSQTKSSDIADFLFRTHRTDDSLLFKIFQNIRDVVRFVNSFKLSFEAIGKFADIYEIILLEILKVKYLSIYQLLSNKRFLTVNNDQYEFDFEVYNDFLSDDNARAINIKPSEKEVIRVILESIFIPKRATYFRSVKHPRYFDIYFTYQVPNLIQLEKIESAFRTLDIDEVIKVVDEAVTDKTIDDLRNFINSQVDFTSQWEFRIILETLFYISKYDPPNRAVTLLQIKNILRNESIAEQFFKEDEDEDDLFYQEHKDIYADYQDYKDIYAEFLLSILKDNKYDLKTRSEIAGDELYKIINKEGQDDNSSVLYKYKKVLQDIVLNCLKDKMKVVTEFDMELFNFYLKNLKEIAPSTRQIVITPEANQVMRNFIIDNKYEYFKKYLLREHPEPSFEGQYFQLDPFLLFYFDNWELVKTEFISNDIKEKLEKEDKGKEFYNLVIQFIESSSKKREEKFLIKEKKEIELAEKFICIIHRNRK